ncbi:MAG: hypothetical protein AAFP69_21470 [Planctomycetota bacterium]
MSSEATESAKPYGLLSREVSVEAFVETTYGLPSPLNNCSSGGAEDMTSRSVSVSRHQGHNA